MLGAFVRGRVAVVVAVALVLPQAIWAQQVSEPFHIGSDPFLGPQVYPQRLSAMAFDGTNYLVVWEDERRGGTEQWGGTDLYGTRIKASGEILDPAGLVISAARGDQWNPAITFGGENYLAVWQQGGGIFGTRVSPGGEILDPEGIAIRATGGTQNSPCVSSDGTDFFAVWHESGEANYIRGARVSSSGAVLDTESIIISEVKGSSSPQVSFGNEHYLVAWPDERVDSSIRDIYGARVSTSGEVLDPDGISVSADIGTESRPAVGSDGTDFLVMWHRGSGAPDMYGARVSCSGELLDSVPFFVGYSHVRAAIAFDGSNYVVATRRAQSHHEGGSYAIRIAPDGTVLSRTRLTDANCSEGRVSVASDGTNSLVAWRERVYLYLGYWGIQGADIIGTRIDGTGEVLDPGGFVISVGNNCQWNPSVAFSGTDYLAVWQDYRGNPSDIYATRISRSGEVLDPEGILVSEEGQWQKELAATSDGNDYLVVWQDYRAERWNIYGCRVDQFGTALDAGGFLIGRGPDFLWDDALPAVVFGETNYLVVWRRGSKVVGARVSESGVLLDSASLVISDADRSQQAPSVVFNGDHYFVVWQDGRNGPPQERDIYGARVEVTGEVLDPNGIPICTNANWQHEPVIAFDGTTYLVVWLDTRPGADYGTIQGTRVSISGEVLDPDPIQISSVSDRSRDPSLAFDGVNYVVAWKVGYNSPTDIYAARVTPTGVVLDAVDIPISTASYSQTSPCVVEGPGGSALIAYSSYTPPPYDADRIMANILIEPTFIRGDADGDMDVDMGDVYYLLGWLNGHNPDPSCMDAADANDDGSVSFEDAVFIMKHLYMKETPPPMPYPHCGRDPTGDRLVCGSYPSCE